MKTYAYIDGFNLYFGALKGTPYRWLDVAKMCERLLRKDDVTRVRYFTARVKTRPHTNSAKQFRRPTPNTSAKGYWLQFWH